MPQNIVNAIAARGQWNEVRPLVGLASGPTLRPDGSVFEVAGYDEQTGVLSSYTAEAPPVPAQPTAEEVAAAVAELLEVVVEFPFVSGEHRSAWLALVLTAVARPAIAGCVPLFLIDANTRGSGKTSWLTWLGSLRRGKIRLECRRCAMTKSKGSASQPSHSAAIRSFS